MTKSNNKMTAPKLTEAQRACLALVLTKLGYLRITRTGFLGEYFAITDAGRAALRDGK